MTIEYHPALEQEIGVIRDYYNSKSPGLGLEFVDEFEKQVLKVAEHPGRWLIVIRDIRRTLMRRFPYVIYFRHLAPDKIRVTVVKHQRRHPDLGRERN